MEVTQTTESTGSAQPSQQADTGSSQSTQGSASTQSEAQSQSPAPDYTPNYKFKYPKLGANEQVEQEFDEWIRPHVTKDTEEKIRDLYTKAHGMDFFKQKYAKVTDTYNQYKESINPSVEAYQTLAKIYNQGDLDTFFKGIGLPEDKLYQYVLDKLQEKELPPEQLQKKQYYADLERKQRALEESHQSLLERYEQESIQTRHSQLDTALSRQDLSPTVQAFDARVGKPGAFKDEVIKRGMLAYQMTGADISPEQAIQEVLMLVGGQVSPQQPQQMGRAQTVTPPVIPNVGSKGSSPATRAPKSLKELKELAAQMD